jgi:nicotinate-nucleotide pyrophosphorylase (carboxylating)
MAAVRLRSPQLPCEVEVDTLDQLDEAFAAGADEVLLDNFTPQQCAEAVRRKEKAGSTARLESSGGLSIDVARAYAETGVDFLAVGALTHSSPSLDLALDLD